MKISIIGCTGRMGCAVLNEALKDPSITISGGFGRYNDKASGVPFSEITGNNNFNIKTSHSIADATIESNIIIDFSTPTLSLEAAEIAAAQKKTFISGTTGFTNKEFQTLEKYSKDTPILWSSNMSIGINLLNILISQTCNILDDNFDTEILEMHHKFKKDAPSGTAITLGKTIANAKNLDFDKVAKLSREGRECDRKKDEIGFATLRGGSVVGDHSVIFTNDNERIEISHKAINRNIFAAGALRAAKWAQNQEPGFYSMQDVLQTAKS